MSTRVITCTVQINDQGQSTSFDFTENGVDEGNASSEQGAANLLKSILLSPPPPIPAPAPAPAPPPA